MALPPGPLLKFPDGGPPLGTTYGEFTEGERVYNVRQAVTPNGAYLLSGGGGDAAITSVTVEAFDLQGSDPDVAIWSSGVIATNTVFKAALTLDGYWDKDGIGYDLFHVALPSDFQHVGGHTFLWRYAVVTPNFGTLNFEIEKRCNAAVGL